MQICLLGNEADNQTKCGFDDKNTKIGTHQLHIIVVILRMRDTRFTKK